MNGLERTEFLRVSLTVSRCSELLQAVKEDFNWWRQEVAVALVYLAIKRREGDGQGDGTFGLEIRIGRRMEFSVYSTNAEFSQLTQQQWKQRINRIKFEQSRQTKSQKSMNVERCKMSFCPESSTLYEVFWGLQGCAMCTQRSKLSS